ncbi:hypothetical protein BU24DRAFT_421994 [Aaosphaeria arxii CBS 175.79]|uniref:Fucose-specific lectin n=1 Tax=Aaosphaeria arxii CBS 175.79 TaxID=1450172 RepID=A0A6A5XQY0_9PLEO|nr:uncharacterized protein BU24DRAFT_421994 [Aaosphaeria arxii CBS 175.79]KAF2015688.1 hypothetical protein BU24DRAFT_421994 [Aaosphaeria arxii CBS 175.79]
MKFTLPLLLTGLLTSLTTAIALPRGSSSAAIQIPGKSELRVYYQNGQNFIFEANVGPPTSAPSATRNIFTGVTRTNTPLAAVTWLETDPANPEIRVYYVTPRNTLAELAFIKGQWKVGADIGFAVQPDSDALYALRVGTTIIVGYSNADGNLAEAYYSTGTPVWQTYTL